MFHMNLITVQAASFFKQRRDSFFNIRILDKHRRMMRFAPGIQDEGSMTTPVFMLMKTVNAVHIMGRIAAGENGPEEIIQVSGQESAVIANNNHDNSLQ